MKKIHPSKVLAGLALFVAGVAAHDLGHPNDPVPHYDPSVRPPLIKRGPPSAGPALLDLFGIPDPSSELVAEPSATFAEMAGDNELAMAIAEVFRPFAPRVRVRWDDNFFYVESDGYPDHPMMTGITAWQQQVPIPQSYFGANAWRFPLRPVVAKLPLSAKDHFFRGAIAIAADGVPIFNPIKNDGRTDTFLAGELDEYGGHAGRADDYHYHVAPLFLEKIVGAGKPIAYALDGYPIYGLNEPDGKPAKNLDAFNGHADTKGNYHYHSTKTYPYINGGFHGEVREADGQVDPQPRANGVRPATEPLRGARIVGFERAKDGSVTLTYNVNGAARKIVYAKLKDGSWRFEFLDSAGKGNVEIYAGDERRQPRDERRAPREEGGGRRREEAPRNNAPEGNEKRVPWIVQHASEMDADRDGILTKDELAAEINRAFGLYDSDRSGRVDADEIERGQVRSALGGFVKQHRDEIDANGDKSLTREELAAVVIRMFTRADVDGDGKLSKEETKDATPLSRPPRRN